jgi:glycosyltransferase involved in cell wall biosynthesis
MNRIIHLINLYPPYVIGGNEMLARDIVEAMRDRGYDVHVVTGRGAKLDQDPYVHSAFNYDLEHRDEIFLREEPFPPWESFRHHIFDPQTYRDVRRTVKELQPDLIIVDNLYMASAAPLLAVRDLSIPVVALVADKWLIYLLRDLTLLLKPDSRLLQWALERYRQWIQPALWRRVRLDKIFLISRFIKSFYVEAGVPAKLMKPTHLGVDTELYTPRQEPHAGTDHLEVVFAGQLWAGKGPQVLVEAMGLLRDRAPGLDLQLRIIGRGSDRFVNQLKREIADHGISDRTVLDGFVPLEILASRLRNGDIFVFPSTWDEPFSITLVAAMASGIPVIATDTGGTPEAFVDGEEGLLIPPGDAEALAEAILRLAQDPDLRNRLSRAAVQRVDQEWSFEAYIDRLEACYREVLEKGEEAA